MTNGNGYGRQQSLGERPQQQQGEQRQSGTALAKAETAELMGSYQQPPAINAALQKLASKCHLVAPATTVGTLPEGCEVVISSVFVDVANETYAARGGNDDDDNNGSTNRGGNTDALALKKSALDRIAASVGIRWIPERCFRVDDGSHPYYCHFKVAGVYRSFDGQEMVITGEKVVDMREGAPSVKGKKPGMVSMVRQHILSHAESKAKNRAIRSIGLRQAYTRKELEEKPFACARIMFTGRTQDPELRKLFAEKISSGFMGGTSALYGEPKALPTEQPGGTPPPPVGARPADDDDDVIPTHGETVTPPQPRTEAPAKPQASGFTVTVDGKEVPIETAPVEALQRGIALCTSDLAEGVVPADEVANARAWRAAAIAQVDARGKY